MLNPFSRNKRYSDLERTARWSLHQAFMEERFENGRTRPAKSKFNRPPKNPSLTLSICTVVFGVFAVLGFICKAWALGAFSALIAIACVVALFR